MKYFNALIKPASSLCNMKCRYCFYQDVTANRSVASHGLMTDGTAKALIRCIYECASPGDDISFAFQGGEPTLAGIDFFRSFINYADKLSDGKYKLHYSIQTNGLLIDDIWAEFFAENKFLVGISVDGYSSLHDYMRSDAKGDATFNRIMSSIKMLTHSGVEYNILSVISNTMAKHPQAVMSQYRKSEWKYIQLIPCLAPLSDTEFSYEPEPHSYANFMKIVFNKWLEGLTHNDYISIRQFDNLLEMLNGNPPEQCGLSGSCTPQFVVEADGSVYPCDFYVLDRYCCGNVNSNSIEEFSNSDGMQHFLEDRIPQSDMCDRCPVYKLCGGGCRRYRSFYYRKKDYCPYQDFLLYALPALQKIQFQMNAET